MVCHFHQLHIVPCSQGGGLNALKNRSNRKYHTSWYIHRYIRISLKVEPARSIQNLIFIWLFDAHILKQSLSSVFVFTAIPNHHCRYCHQLKSFDRLDFDVLDSGGDNGKSRPRFIVNRSLFAHHDVICHVGSVYYQDGETITRQVPQHHNLYSCIVSTVSLLSNVARTSISKLKETYERSSHILFGEGSIS